MFLPAVFNHGNISHGTRVRLVEVFTCLSISSTCEALFALPSTPKNGIRLDKSHAVPSVADILGYFTIKSDISCRYSSGTFSIPVPISLPSHSVIVVTHVSGFMRGLATLSTSPAIHNTPPHNARPAAALASKFVIHRLPSLLSVFCLSSNTFCASMIASLPVFAISRGNHTILLSNDLSPMFPYFSCASGYFIIILPNKRASGTFAYCGRFFLYLCTYSVCF